MSRFTGPRLKVMRAPGVELPGLSRKSTEAVCEKLAGQWGDARTLAPQARHPARADVSPLLH